MIEHEVGILADAQGEPPRFGKRIENEQIGVAAFRLAPLSRRSAPASSCSKSAVCNWSGASACAAASILRISSGDAVCGTEPSGYRHRRCARRRDNGCREFLARKVDGDPLFGHERIGRDDNSDDERAAEHDEFRAGAQISEHGRVPETDLSRRTLHPGSRVPYVWRPNANTIPPSRFRDSLNRRRAWVAAARPTRGAASRDSECPIAPLTAPSQVADRQRPKRD